MGDNPEWDFLPALKKEEKKNKWHNSAKLKLVKRKKKKIRLSVSKEEGIMIIKNNLKNWKTPFMLQLSHVKD